MDNKIETLKRWLASNAYFDEAHNVSILKVAISLDDAKDLLNTSNRIPKIIKGILWQLKIKHDPKDILILASNYREAVLKLVPADITEKQKAQAIQWLTQIGKRDSNTNRHCSEALPRISEAIGCSSGVKLRRNRFQ